MTVDQLVARSRSLRRHVDQQIGQLRAVAQSRSQASEQVVRQTALLEELDAVSVFLTSFAEEAQLSMQRKIEALVTHALRTVFDEDMEFKLVADTKARASTLDFVIVSKMDGVDVETPVIGSRGGGVAAVVGFLLRLVVLLLSENRHRVMFLDETFAQVSEEYEPRVAEFLREIADKAGVQIVLVTHSSAYSDVADKHYRFRQVDGVTKVEAA